MQPASADSLLLLQRCEGLFAADCQVDDQHYGNEEVLRIDLLQAKIAKVVFPFTLLAVYVVWMLSRSDRVVRAPLVSFVPAEAL